VTKSKTSEPALAALVVELREEIARLQAELAKLQSKRRRA
jgi:uncharacterized small protein (DUF1192 family)